MKKLLAIQIFVMFLLVTMVGCEAIGIVSPIVTGVIMWKEGEAHKYYPYDEEIVYRSAKRALEDMALETTTDDPKDDGGFYIVAGEEDRFKINIDNAKDDIAELRVRVNFMGDKPYAELFYSKVDDQLSTIRFDDNGRPMYPDDYESLYE